VLGNVKEELSNLLLNLDSELEIQRRDVKRYREEGRILRQEIKEFYTRCEMQAM
jgi:hypothetical protein